MFYLVPTIALILVPPDDGMPVEVEPDRRQSASQVGNGTKLRRSEDLTEPQTRGTENE